MFIGNIRLQSWVWWSTDACRQQRAVRTLTREIMCIDIHCIDVGDTHTTSSVPRALRALLTHTYSSSRTTWAPTRLPAPPHPNRREGCVWAAKGLGTWYISAIILGPGFYLLCVYVLHAGAWCLGLAQPTRNI